MMKFLDFYGQVQYTKSAHCIRLGMCQECPTADEPAAYTVFDHCHMHGWIRGELCKAHNSQMAMIDRGVHISRWKSWMLSHWMSCTECASSLQADNPSNPAVAEYLLSQGFRGGLATSSLSPAPVIVQMDSSSRSDADSSGLGDGAAPIYERFRPDAWDAVVRSKKEAIQLGQPEIGSAHLLVSLLDGNGLAYRALTAAGADTASLRAQLPRINPPAAEPLDGAALATIGIDLDLIRRITDARFGPGSIDRPVRRGHRHSRIVRPPMAKSLSRAIECALSIADRLGHWHISDGHLLLGLLDQPASPAMTVLTDAGVDIAGLRDDVARRMVAAA